jgi:hypothetical protein
VKPTLKNIKSAKVYVSGNLHLNKGQVVSAKKEEAHSIAQMRHTLISTNHGQTTKLTVINDGAVW